MSNMPHGAAPVRRWLARCSQLDFGK